MKGVPQVQITANGLSLEVEQHGPTDAQSILLIRGLGSQLIHWPEGLIDALVGHGLHVITFDNRDSGLSQKFTEYGAPDFTAMEAALAKGDAPELPYETEDMARDAIGVLDALGIKAAHVLGMSMGGMIAQTLALEHSDRLISATIVMSTSGLPGLPAPTPEAAIALTAYPENPDDRNDVIEFTLKSDRVWMSPGFPFDPDQRRALIGRAYDRCYYPEGVQRQYASLLGWRGRFNEHAQIAVPVLVVHGTDDTLLPVDHGRDIAARIPGAELYEINGMGHDLEGGIPDLIVSRLIAFLGKHGLR